MKYKFCPKCGKPLSLKKVDHRPRLFCKSCKFIFYQNSKPCVGALIVKGNSVLLTQRGIEPYYGQWDIPGGFLEECEDPEAGLKRELMEELGLRCKVEKLLGVGIDTYGESGDKTLTLFYAVKPTGKILKAADDVAAYQYFKLSLLPSNIAFPSLKRMLTKLVIDYK